MLIIHYHIFKNAGTSVDAMLQRNFGNRWTEVEFSWQQIQAAGAAGPFGELLRQQPDLVAVSSHTAQLPLPAAMEVFPIFFLRHPLDRLRSAYAFERNQDSDTLGARLAKQHDFEGYVRSWLAKPGQSQARNFQSRRLAGNPPPKDDAEQRERALRTLAGLRFVGLVEAYEESIIRLRELLVPYFPNFHAYVAHENKTSNHQDSAEDRIEKLKNSVSETVWEELIAANSIDFEIYELASKRYLR